MKTINKKTQGFTLVELLVVISIIGVLSAVLMINFVGTRERARDAQKIQDLTSLKSALRMYYNDNQAYPIASGVCSNSGVLGTALKTNYFPGIGSSMPWCNYESTDGNSFVLKTTLESSAGDSSTTSQAACNLTPVAGVYAVCAN